MFGGQGCNCHSVNEFVMWLRMRALLISSGILILGLGCRSEFEQSANKVFRTTVAEPDSITHEDVPSADPEVFQSELESASDDLAKEFGAPKGWRASILRKRKVVNGDDRVTRAVLQLETKNDDSYPFRLVIAESTNDGFFKIRIKTICGAGFITYSERLFKVAPKAVEFEEFAYRKGSEIDPA